MYIDCLTLVLLPEDNGGIGQNARHVQNAISAVGIDIVSIGVPNTHVVVVILISKSNRRWGNFWFEAFK